MKPLPFRQTHRADFDNIFTFSNEFCMQDLSLFDQILKQLKSQQVNWQNVNADISMTSPKLFQDVDVAEEGDDKWQPMTRYMLQTWTNTIPTHGM
jgi:hypothetical protein